MTPSCTISTCSEGPQPPRSMYDTGPLIAEVGGKSSYVEERLRSSVFSEVSNSSECCMFRVPQNGQHKSGGC